MDDSTLLTSVRDIPVETVIKFLAPIKETVTAVYEIEFNPEVADLIHPHWLTFPPQPYLFHLVLAVIIATLGFISICGNSAVTYIFTQTRGLRNPSNALIVNLAISDLLMMITQCPVYVTTSLSGKWVFGHFACQFHGFTGALFGTASILTMAAIAVDRYLVICKPFLIMKSTMTRERAKFAIAFVWIYSFIWAVIPLCGISNYVLEGFLTTCSFDYLDKSEDSRAFIFAMFIGAYAAPLFTIIISYFLIIWEVRAHSKKFAKAASNLKVGANKENEENAKQKKEVKTAKIAAAIIMCWTVAWTPYAIVALLGILGGQQYLTPIASQLPAVFAKTAAVYNPIVYAISHPKYREALKKKFPFLICIKDSEFENSKRATSSAGQAGSRSRRTINPQVSADVDSANSEVIEFTESTPQPVSVISKSERTIIRSAQPNPDDSPINRKNALNDVIKAAYNKGKEQEVELAVRRAGELDDVTGAGIQSQHIGLTVQTLQQAHPLSITTVAPTSNDQHFDVDNLSLFNQVTTV